MKTLNSISQIACIGSLLLTGCPGPAPKPSPKPTSTPTPVATPTPILDNACPAPKPVQSAMTINARCLYYTPETGKCVTDSTPRVGDIGDDKGYCAQVTGDSSIKNCKANPEGSGLDVCDTQFLGVKCMPWFYSKDLGKTWKRCIPDAVGASKEFSCDHFDNWIEYQGDYTGKCETRNGVPITGYSMVPHGDGLVRACTLDQSVCSEPIKVNY